MSKILVTADIHLYNYSNYNNGKYSRLSQFIVLAKIMVDFCLKSSIKHIFICGDLLDRYTPEPIVLHTLHKFLNKLTDVADVWICHGNHDCCKQSPDPEHIYYSVIENPKVHYLHNQEVNLGGRKFYFKGWEPHPKYENTSGADVLVTHAYVQGATLASGMEIRESGVAIDAPYKLIIAGDIHKFQKIGKILIPGTPIQNSFSDSSDTGFCVLETDDLSWERISTANCPDFIKFCYSDDPRISDKQVEYMADVENSLKDNVPTIEDWFFEKYGIVARGHKAKQAQAPVDFKSLAAIDLNEILDELLKDFRYKEELYLVLGQNSKALESFANQELKASLKAIKVFGFKSIESCMIDFTTIRGLSVIQGSNGSGKAQPLTASILTPQGFKKLGTLKVGDEVYSFDGSITKIIGYFPQGIKPCYRLTTLDGQTTECCGEHLWRVRVNVHGRHVWKTLTTAEILFKGVKNDKSYKYFLPSPRPIQYPEQDLLIHPYVMGVLIAEGCLTGSHSLSFSNPEDDIIDKVADLVGEDYCITENLCNYTKTIKLRVRKYGHKNLLLQEIKRLRLNTFSTNRFIPDIYKFSSVEQRKQLLAGLFDSDGNVAKNKKRYSYSTSSLKLANDMVDLCRGLGYQSRIHRNERLDKPLEKRKPDYTISIMTNDIIFTSKKHGDRYKKGIGKNASTYETTAIKSIERIENKEMACIMVDHPSHLYITDNYIVTHNTTLFEAIMWALTGNSFAETEDVIQSGSSYCEVKLCIEYQNQDIIIARSRGSKFELNITVAGKPLIANNKTDLQKKLEETLPIINKLHLLYFNQSRDGLLSELNDAARVSLISELSGQSIVSDLSLSVEEKVNDLKEDAKSAESAYDAKRSTLEGLKSAYQEVEDPTERITKLQIEIEEIHVNTEKVIKQKHEIDENSRLACNEKYKEKTKIKENVEQEIEKKVQVLNHQKDGLQEKIFEETEKTKKIQGQISAQRNIASKKPEWSCDKCGTVIKAKDFTQEDLDKARIKLTELQAQSETLTLNINDLKSLLQKNSDDQSLLKKQSNQKIHDLSIQIDKDLDNIDKDAMEKKKVLDEQIKIFLAQKQLKDSELKDLLVQKGLYVKSLEIKQKIDDLKKGISKTKNEFETKKEKFEAFKKINNEVFGNDGLLSAAILEKLSRVINTDHNIKITTTKTLKNGKVKPTLDLAMKIGEHFEPYRRLSGGERLYADLYFLSKMIEVVSGIGFLICDETFKYFDPDYVERSFKMLSQIPSQNTFLVYHGELMENIISNPNITKIGVFKRAGNSIYVIEQ